MGSTSRYRDDVYERVPIVSYLYYELESKCLLLILVYIRACRDAYATLQFLVCALMVLNWGSSFEIHALNRLVGLYGIAPSISGLVLFFSAVVAHRFELVSLDRKSVV